MNDQTPKFQCAFLTSLGAFHDDQLPADQKAAVTHHLATCGVCQTELAALRELSAQLTALPEMPLTSEFRQRLQQAWNDQQNDRSAIRMAYSLLAMAACLFISFTLWVPWTTTTPESTTLWTPVVMDSDTSSNTGQEGVVLANLMSQDFPGSSEHE